MIFQYFLPVVSKDAVTADTLAACGLAPVFRDCLRSEPDFQRLCTRMDVAVGPTGTSGALVAALPTNDELPHRLGFHPDHQEWVEIEGKYWLGSDTEPEQKPTPAGLARDPLIGGYEFELGDGQVWQCPVIRYPVGSSNLPSRWGVDPKTGDFREQILAEYEDAWQMAGEMWDVFMGEKEIEEPESFRYAVRALGLNYRLGPHEAARMGLLTSTNYMHVFKAAIHGPMIEELLKEEESKKNSQPPPPESSTPGPPADSPNTGPAAASCI